MSLLLFYRISFPSFLCHSLHLPFFVFNIAIAPHTQSNDMNACNTITTTTKFTSLSVSSSIFLSLFCLFLTFSISVAQNKLIVTNKCVIAANEIVSCKHLLNKCVREREKKRWTTNNRLILIKCKHPKKLSHNHFNEQSKDNNNNNKCRWAIWW